jgi:hypothetical protein
MAPRFCRDAAFSFDRCKANLGPRESLERAIKSRTSCGHHRGTSLQLFNPPDALIVTKTASPILTLFPPSSSSHRRVLASIARLALFRLHDTHPGTQARASIVHRVRSVPKEHDLILLCGYQNVCPTLVESADTTNRPRFLGSSVNISRRNS